MSKQTVKVKSHAKWTKIKNSYDTHHRQDNKTAIEFAFAIAYTLRSYYMNEECEIRGKCLDSWVTIDGKRYNYMSEVDMALIK